MAKLLCCLELVNYLRSWDSFQQELHAHRIKYKYQYVHARCV